MIKYKNKNTNDNNFNDANTEIDNNFSKTIIYTCKNKLPVESINYETYQIETITVKDNIAISSTPTIIVLCKDETTYNNFKSDTEYSKNKEFNDQEKSISFSNGNIIDLTQDTNGNSLKVDYNEYQSELIKVGYTCVEK